MAKVLIVDDRPGVRASVVHPLRRAGHDVHETGSLPDALEALRLSRHEAVFVDSHAAREPGNGHVVSRIMAVAPGTAVVMMTCSGSVAEAVQAIKTGAHDYLQLPIEPGHLARVIRNIVDERPQRATGPASLRHPLRPLEGIVTIDPKMKQLFEQVHRVAEVDCTVLITGESGTGKEVVARTIFEESPQRGGRFVPLNCGAIPEMLAESELFGHRKGSFTGAMGDHAGLIEEAEGGVLFLDEIGEMSARLQVTLLRFLDRAEVRRVGETAVRHVNTRVIAATNRPLADDVRRGVFRPDLFYRLSVVSLRVPPLRERRDDVAALAERFLRTSAAKFKRSAPALSSDALRLLRRYDWPGNVRELQNVIEGALVLARGDVIGTGDLPIAITGSAPLALARSRASERARAAEVVECFKGNQTQAAAALGISRSTLWRMLHQHGPGDAHERICGISTP